MESRPRDRKTPEAVVAAKALSPRDRRLPLSVVRFKNPAEIPGAPHPLHTLESKKPVLGCDEFTCPQMYLDPELQVVVIEGRHFPIADVRYYERAKAA